MTHLRHSSITKLAGLSGQLNAPFEIQFEIKPRVLVRCPKIYEYQKSNNTNKMISNGISDGTMSFIIWCWISSWQVYHQCEIGSTRIVEMKKTEKIQWLKMTGEDNWNSQHFDHILHIWLGCDSSIICFIEIKHRIFWPISTTSGCSHAALITKNRHFIKHKIVVTVHLNFC